MEHNPPSTYPIKATQNNPTATCPDPRPASQMTNQTLETWHWEISQRETRSFLTHRALAPSQLRATSLESLVLFVFSVWRENEKQQCGCERHRCWTAIPSSPAHCGAKITNPLPLRDRDRLVREEDKCIEMSPRGWGSFWNTSDSQRDRASSTVTFPQRLLVWWAERPARSSS